MILISDLTVVTVDPARRIITDAAIVIDGPAITAVGKDAQLRTQFPGAEVRDGGGKIAIPGLIDTHCHADQSILRGLGDRLHWMPFLDDIIDPYLAGRDPEECVIANQVAMLEMLKSGTTCFVSPNVDPSDDYGALSDAIGDLGIRAVLARFTMPRPGEDSPEFAREVLRESMPIMRRWHEGQGGLVHFWFGLDVPRRPGDTDHPSFYREIMLESRQLGVGITYHFCSEIEDADYIVERYDLRPAEWSRDNHALGANVLLINGCQIDHREIQIIAESGSHLAHSPVANMKMATGILPLPAVMDAGINVSLGTDGALNNNSYDMFGEMKSACLLQNAVCRDANAMSAESALEMATINGARAIGREDELGSIECGKHADLVLLDMSTASSAPIHDLVSNIVFSSGPSNVASVYIDGKQVVDEGMVCGVDERGLVEKFAMQARDLRDRLGLKRDTTWPVS